MKQTFHRDEQDILRKAELIDPSLASFLNDSKFSEVWLKIRRNVRDEDNLIKQLNCWFDGFKTLKLINYLSRDSFPPVDMFYALEIILKLNKITFPQRLLAPNTLLLSIQKKILQHLREVT
jgi:hypothetical protein